MTRVRLVSSLVLVGLVLAAGGWRIIKSPPAAHGDIAIAHLSSADCPSGRVVQSELDYMDGPGNPSPPGQLIAQHMRAIGLTAQYPGAEQRLELDFDGAQMRDVIAANGRRVAALEYHQQAQGGWRLTHYSMCSS